MNLSQWLKKNASQPALFGEIGFNNPIDCFFKRGTTSIFPGKDIGRKIITIPIIRKLLTVPLLVCKTLQREKHATLNL